ncbi:hypothetical protein HY480_00025 [Candidatus Uhrbacteria bacterium]|nr:hypothetical protein [Candidatus Uhrbacteria bacterium]
MRRVAHTDIGRPESRSDLALVSASVALLLFGLARIAIALRHGIVRNEPGNALIGSISGFIIMVLGVIGIWLVRRSTRNTRRPDTEGGSTCD